jgi:hypothetical protein
MYRRAIPLEAAKYYAQSRNKIYAPTFAGFSLYGRFPQPQQGCRNCIYARKGFQTVS